MLRLISSIQVDNYDMEISIKKKKKNKTILNFVHNYSITLYWKKKKLKLNRRP